MSTKLFVIAAAAVCGLAAQDSSHRIKVNVPFGFEANGVKLAAGTYIVTAPGNRPIVTVSNEATGKRIMIMAGAASDNRLDVNSLEFKRYNDVYFLSGVKVAAVGKKFALPHSRLEKEMAIAIRPEVIIARAK